MQSEVYSGSKPYINASSSQHPLLLVRLVIVGGGGSVASAALGGDNEKSYLEQKGGECKALPRPAHAPGSVSSACI